MKLFKKHRSLTRRQKALRSIVIMIAAIILARLAGASFGMLTSKYRALREMENRLCIPYTDTIKELEHFESSLDREKSYYRFARAEDVLVLSRLSSFGRFGLSWFCSEELTSYVSINYDNPICRTAIFTGGNSNTVAIRTAGIIIDDEITDVRLFYDFENEDYEDMYFTMDEYFTYNGERYFYCSMKLDRYVHPDQRGDWTLLCYNENGDMIFDFERDYKFY